MNHTQNIFVSLSLALSALAGAQAQTPSWKEALTFYASFDHGIDADYAAGDGHLYTRLSTNPKEAPVAGLPPGGETQLARGAGRSGHALRFTEREAPWLFYKAAENVPYQAKDWSGSVSLWLKLDPQKDLDPGYCDPFQLTTRSWDDGAFFVDFDKEGDPRDFRLGVFPDRDSWNPKNKEVPEDQRPLHKVANPPFSKEAWTHIAVTWEKFNTGSKDGVATFYINGNAQGTIEGWQQTFTWKADEESRLYLGLNYKGLLDEVATFRRALSADEIAELYHTQNALTPETPELKKAFIDGNGPGWRALEKTDFVNVNCDPETWTWEDGLIKCTGTPVGVIRTTRPYTNFELVVEWKHLSSGGNSGVFAWASPASIENLSQGKGRLPDGIEVQVLDHGYTEQYESAYKKPADWFTTNGDVFPTGPAKMIPFAPVAPGGQRSFPSKNLSKGVNEWNHYYVRAINGEVRLWVNGEEVSGGTQCEPATGFLCLESEGAPIHFRNLRLRELP